MNFSEWMVCARARKGLTQRDVAQKVGCSTNWLSSIEAGRERPSDRLRNLIEKAIGEKYVGDLGPRKPPAVTRGLRIGDWLMTARARAGLRQADVAIKVGCDRTYLSWLENNRRSPSQGLLRRLESALGAKYQQRGAA